MNATTLFFMRRCPVILLASLLFGCASPVYGRRVLITPGSYDVQQQLAPPEDIALNRRSGAAHATRSLATLLVERRTGRNLGQLLRQRHHPPEVPGSRAIVNGRTPLSRQARGNQTINAMLESLRGGEDVDVDDVTSSWMENEQSGDKAERRNLQELRGGSRQESETVVRANPSWHAQHVPRHYSLGVYSGQSMQPHYTYSSGTPSSNETEEEREQGLEQAKSAEPLLLPFRAGRPDLEMESVEESLARGSWKSVRINGSIVSGQAVMDLDAPPDEVWKQLLDFASYSRKVPRLGQSEVYNRSQDGGKIHTWVKFVYNSLPGLKYTYHVEHTYDKGKKSITWSLDSSDGKKNDAEEEQGHWHVEPNPQDSSKSRVFYEIGMSFRNSWLPEIARERLARNAVNDAMSWVKKESELGAMRSEAFEEKTIKKNIESQDGEDFASDDTEEAKLRSFHPGRPSFIDEDQVTDMLEQGKTWESLKVMDKTAVGQACMDVDASPSIVWKQLLDFSSYSQKVPRLSASEIYRRTGEGNKLEHIFVKFVYSALPGVKYTFYVDHAHAKAKNSLTWSLDVNESLTSDFEDEQGQWHVEPHPHNSSRSRVWYEIGITYPRWLPRMAIKPLAKKFMSVATSWVKRESELEALKGEEEVTNPDAQQEEHRELDRVAGDTVEITDTAALGKLEPFRRGRPALKVKPDEEQLGNGNVWQLPLEVNGKTAIGRAVVDIDAPPGVVWEQLLDFDAYSRKVPRLRTSTVYDRSKEGNNLEHIFAKFVYRSFPGVSYTYNVDHTLDKAKNSLTWTLDRAYGMKNDADDEQGHWHVEPHPSDPAKSRVYYEIGLVYPRWLVSKSIAHFTNGVIADATTWLKRESEHMARQYQDETERELEAKKRQAQEAEEAKSKQLGKNSKKLASFEQGAPAIASEKAVQDKLDKGEMWQSLSVNGNAVVGQVAFDIDAPASVIWSQLQDLAAYSEKMPGIRSSEIYKADEEKNDIRRSFVKLVNPVIPGIKLSYHLEHEFEPGKNSMIFYLDGSKKNDFQEVQGHWYVEEHPSGASKSRVFYQIGLVTPGFVPKRIIDKVAQKAMEGSVSWVKRESEIEASGSSEIVDKSTKKLLPPFQRGRPPLIMDFVERVLTRGQVWQSIQLIGNTAIGQAVMDVSAPPNVVWNQLFDFARYPDKVPYVRESTVYRRTVEGSSLEQIFVKFVYSLIPGYEVTYNVKHTYEPEQNSISWSLDESRKNSFIEDEGHWHVEPHPDDPSKSRVFFEIGIVYPGWLPRRLMAGLAQRYIENATPWVKKASESEAKRLGDAATSVSLSSGSLLHSSGKKFR